MNPRILLVEDDPTSRAFLQAATESLPAHVDGAATMAEALALAARHDYALWLVDAHLPDGSGSGLLARLRAQASSVPAIAHTASHDRGEHDALLAAGFVATIAKPLSAADWLAAIRAVLAADDTSDASDATATNESAETVADLAATPVWDDAVALSALAGNADSVSALRRLFLDELPGVRDALEQAARRHDLDVMRAHLHRLRASCGFVGATRLDTAASMLRDAPLSEAALQAFATAAQDTLSS